VKTKLLLALLLWGTGLSISFYAYAALPIPATEYNPNDAVGSFDHITTPIGRLA